MKPPHTLLAASLALLASGSLHASETSNPLVAERWQSRPLVVIAPHADDPLLTELRRALQQPSNREAFIEREMVLYTVVDGVGARNDQPLDGAQTAGLLKALGVKSAAPARVILVGKDGGKKMEQTEQVVPAELFALIDKMPMRQKP
jgi:hypothetical protein